MGWVSWNMEFSGSTFNIVSKRPFWVMGGGGGRWEEGDKRCSENLTRMAKESQRQKWEGEEDKEEGEIKKYI